MFRSLWKRNFGLCIITARVAKRAKVMFSQASVILSLNRGGGRWTTPPPLQARVRGQPPLPLARVRGQPTPPWTTAPPPKHPGTMHRWNAFLFYKFIHFVFIGGELGTDVASLQTTVQQLYQSLHDVSLRYDEHTPLHFNR